jgi:hypothetical protein
MSTRTTPHVGQQIRWTASSDGQQTAIVCSAPTPGTASFAGNRIQPSVTIRWDEDGVESTLSCPGGYLPSDFVDTGV